MSDLLDKKCTIEKCWICQKNCLWYPHNDKRDFVLAKPDLIKWRLDNCPEPSVSTKAMMLDILKRYSTGEIVKSGEEKEKEYMDNREILKELDEAIKLNREARMKNNDAMCHAKNALSGNRDDDSYKRGLEEAWTIAKKIGADYGYGGYYSDDIELIFGKQWFEVFTDMTIHEVKEKIEAWEKEQAKPKLGDVVKINFKPVYDTEEVGVYVYEKDNCIRILRRTQVKVLDTINIDKDLIQSIEKTGKHFDIASMLDELG